MSNSILIIGLGNAYRSDDGVGPFVARRLKKRLGKRVRVLDHCEDVLSLLEQWRGASVVVVIDAARSGAPPGTVHRFEAHRQPLPGELFALSTHSLGLPAAIELARSTGQLPPRLIVYGIEVGRTAPEIGISPAIQVAARQVIEEIPSRACPSSTMQFAQSCGAEPAQPKGELPV